MGKSTRTEPDQYKKMKLLISIAQNVFAHYYSISQGGGAIMTMDFVLPHIMQIEHKK